MKKFKMIAEKKYRHMMVDEFQDTNQLQMNMLVSILHTDS
ncbi:UvrD-helicase domain-containing protein [Anaerobacillus sp. HL2]|nr:UvrD-helicase domain-containing protein [Anaerobacillus sp. HL2]